MSINIRKGLPSMCLFLYAFTKRLKSACGRPLRYLWRWKARKENFRLVIPDPTQQAESPTSLLTAIAYCSSVEQVQAAVRYAQDKELKIVVTSGSPTSSFCVGDGLYQEDSSLRTLLVNVGGLDVIELLHGPHAKHQIRIEPGVSLHRISTFCITNGLFFTYGIHKQGYAGGQLQTSGIGIAANAFGCGPDAVVAFRMVRADGVCREYRASDEDLRVYKAVLGGGSGSWGVVVEYTVLCVPDTTFPHSESVSFTYNTTPDIVEASVNAVTAVLREQQLRGRCDFSVGMCISTGESGGGRDETRKGICNLPFLRALLYSGSQPNSVSVYIVYSGKDSGPLTNALYATYFRPLIDIGLPCVRRVMAPMSFLTSPATLSWPDVAPWEAELLATSTTYLALPTGLFATRLGEEIRRRTTSMPSNPSEQWSGFSIQLMYLGGQSHVFAANAARNSILFRRAQCIMCDRMLFKANTTTPASRGTISLAVMARLRGDMQTIMCSGGSNTTSAEREIDKAEFPTATLLQPTGSASLYTSSKHQRYSADDEAYSKLQHAKNWVDPDDVFHGRTTVPPGPPADGRRVIDQMPRPPSSIEYHIPPRCISNFSPFFYLHDVPSIAIPDIIHAISPIQHHITSTPDSPNSLDHDCTMLICCYPGARVKT